MKRKIFLSRGKECCIPQSLAALEDFLLHFKVHRLIEGERSLTHALTKQEYYRSIFDHRMMASIKGSVTLKPFATLRPTDTHSSLFTSSHSLTFPLCGTPKDQRDLLDGGNEDGNLVGVSQEVVEPGCQTQVQIDAPK